ncbi:MAG: type II toxin-antitoxin system YafQ family toxin [Oscillospiraceae bacterium]|nr:type II toxin-antitoxin system YafQ family toxin [Oscillospiraceae bacterium]
MLTFETTVNFRRDVKRAGKRGLDISKLEAIVDTLLTEVPLAPKHQDHALTGDYIGHRECHIQPDWLLIYAVDGENLILTASRTGSHADLFR